MSLPINNTRYPFTIESSDQTTKGDGFTIHSFHVFDGIDFIFDSIHTNKVSISKDHDPHITQIMYCLEGRMEQHALDRSWYLSKGDLAIVKAELIQDTLVYPSNHYHGLTIRIDRRMCHVLSSDLLSLQLDPTSVLQPFDDDDRPFVLRGSTKLDSIFASLYALPSLIQHAYLKLKVMELLMLLSTIEPKENTVEKRLVSSNQVSMVKTIADHLSTHLDRSLSLEDIAATFHAHPVYLNRIFKAVYGVGIASYIRAKKMESSALMLEQTDKTILDIANAHGYTNASKFASTFKRYKQLTPSQYRKLWHKS